MARTRESGRDGIVGASRRVKAGRGRAPGVDALEPRKLLAAVSWDSGGGDGLWSNPLNWSGDVLPGQGDDVTIDWGAGRRVIAADQTVIRVNSLALSELLVVNRNMTLNVNEAFDIEPAGAIRINGLVNWVEGTWASDDPVAVNPGGVLNIGSSQNPASGSVTLDADLNNLGAVSWRGGDVALNGTLTSQAGKVFALSGPGALSGSGEVVNHGLMRRSGDSGTASTIAVPMTNTDRVHLLSGGLVLGDGGGATVFTNTGRIASTAIGATVTITGASTHDSVELHGPGEIVFTGGVHTFAGTHHLGGSARIFEGAEVVIAESGSTFNGRVTLDGARVTMLGDWTIDQAHARYHPHLLTIIDSELVGPGSLNAEGHRAHIGQAGTASPGMRVATGVTFEVSEIEHFPHPRLPDQHRRRPDRRRDQRGAPRA